MWRSARCKVELKATGIISGSDNRQSDPKDECLQSLLGFVVREAQHDNQRWKRKRVRTIC